MEPSNRPARARSVLVAGHLCLDMIPLLGADVAGSALAPGSLEIVGPAALAVGGCVGNTGIALHRLGVPTDLVARIGDDAFGSVLAGLVRAAVPRPAAHLVVTPGGSTSYSVIHNRPGADRAIQHFPGVNATFRAADVPSVLLRRAALLHVGYPPLMAALVAGDGRELRELLEAARANGAATSLDMASANRDPGDAPVDWPALLRRVLPVVDVFLPSLDEAGHLLGRTGGSAASRTDPWPGKDLLARAARLADEMLALGAGIAGVKLGDRGLYVRTAAAARLAGVAHDAAWADRELWSPVFDARVVGTTGAGDATIAGFLLGLVRGLPPEATLTAACAVGGASTEAADGTSGIPSWAVLEARLRAGWRRAGRTTEPGWTAGPLGVWRGPRDSSPAGI